MLYFHWILLAAFLLCLLQLGVRVAKIFRAGAPKDYSAPIGDKKKAIGYSFTGAMSPKHKESAYLHLPTYAAGIFYHMGTFFGLLWLIILFTNLILPAIVIQISAIFLFVSAAAGLGILIKRIVAPKMRQLSNADDFISNLLVTGFQAFLGIALLMPQYVPQMMIYTAILFLYMPVGKLRHCAYFFAARLHLGYFFGHRGVWPVKHG